jgi:hypothetical protein
MKQKRGLRDWMQRLCPCHCLGKIEHSLTLEAKEGREIGYPSPLPFHLSRTCQPPDAPRELAKQRRVVAGTDTKRNKE